MRMLRSWEKNAGAWTEAVRERRIASRRAGTDDAIIAAVLAIGPGSVLDMGCGEGWLARALSMQGCRVVGIDASDALIASARNLGGARFETMTYNELDARAAELGAPFDAVVCNFSLLDADLSPALELSRNILNPLGRLLIQTVHPWVAGGGEPYVDGWRVEEFAGFGTGFVEPMPWYFRTLGSWMHALGAAGFRIARVAEPIDASNGRPLSLLIQTQPAIAAELL
jgi:2-polyprenyl-3-methyl-5-hydroxy-6-metoxy-1,4-benzoquinol methylase